MEIKLKRGYIQIVSPIILRLAGILNGTSRTPRAAALFPFIFFRSEEEIVPWIINHERIHFRQQIETLFIGVIVLGILETLYATLILKKHLDDAYLWRSAEQEAYRNQQNQQYLQNRPFWNQFKYLTNKKEFILGSPGEIIYR